ncbi:nickel ABC transporter permease [Sporolactobacillus vineae]|uniref:nickel ABC transporter permease n=1 Tax=Sporolactobacillus vineae TaxID=444463 RepID=UPI000287C69E|nr:nickel ABC transporter permease [Sporolactobacillus vineae]
MLLYVLKRLLHSIYVILAISLIVFIALRLTGDPVAVMFGAGEPTKSAIEHLRASLGLDKPLIMQYLIFLKGIFTLNLGTSFRTGQPVSGMIFSRMGATVVLAFAGVIVALIIAIPVGIISAVKRGTAWDFLGRIFSLLGLSFPNFWLGIMLIMFFAVYLDWLPASGYDGPVSIILPSLTLGLILAGVLARLVRSSMLEVLNKQYITVAKSKGTSEWLVVLRHGFRNALIPVVTFLGIQFGSLLGGTVIIEQVFAWPGVGQLIINAISERDYPVVQGGVIILALLMVFVNLLVDLSYQFIDPRIKVEGRKA